MATPDQRQVVRVFLASPSDLAHERQLAKDVVDNFNREWADYLCLQIELVVWEDAVSFYGRPQDAFNQDLARCEFFVGMLWQEWGTPTSRYSSGFEEEFNLAEQGFRKSGRPIISLLFKIVDKSRLNDPGEKLRKILEFKEKIQGKVLYNTFGSDGEFRQRFRGILTEHVQQLSRRESERQAREKQINLSQQEASAERALTEESEVPQLPTEALGFVRQFAAKAEHSEKSQAVSASEIARFRLLGTLVNQHGNDDDVLGVHDANTLFANRFDMSLTERECAALVDTGLVHFAAENVPYWYWLRYVGGLEGNVLALRTIVGSDAKRAGALKLMHLVRLPLPDAEVSNRPFYVESWLEGEVHHSVREAALAYLAVCGVKDDLPAIRAEIDRADYQTVKRAIHAYVTILLRNGCEPALAALIEMQPESIDSSLVDHIFARQEKLSKATLEQAASHRSPALRVRAVRALRNRHALSKELVDQSSNDSAPDVRLEALLARLDSGELITEGTARDVLVRRKPSGGLGLFGGFGSTMEGTVQLKQFMVAWRKTLPAADLRRHVETNTIFGHEFKFEEIRRDFKTRGDELRNAVTDCFQQWFHSELDALRSAIGNPETLQKVVDHEGNLRKQWTRDALDIIVGKRQCQDLPLLRSALASGYATVSEHDISLITKCGEWQDVGIVMAFVNGTKSGKGTLLGPYLTSAEMELIARTLATLGGDRLLDILALEISDRLKAAVVKNATASTFKALNKQQLLQLLQDPSDTLRRAVALKCVIVLSKARLKSLFDAYMTLESTRYYNVITWLDLGLSIDRETATGIASRAMAATDD